MNRTDIINMLIEKFNYQSYLEIGLCDPEGNYLNVHCRHKECVDPYETNIGADFIDNDLKHYIETYILTYKMTSDKFFSIISEDKKYDIIFIDGLHTEEQVGRDIINSFKHLNPGGLLVVHDCLPYNKEAQEEERTTEIWNGSVWKVIPQLGLQNINYYVIDTDWGCGILQYFGNPNELTYPEKADYDYDQVFSSKTIRDIVMHVVTPDEFLGVNIKPNPTE